MHRLKDIERVKPSLRGKKVLVINTNKENYTVELLEDAWPYKKGQQLLSFASQVEEVEE